MKKIISTMLILSLCSCSAQKLSTETQTEQPKTATITEAETITEQTTTATEIPPVPTTEPPTEPEINELLYNDNGIEIYYQGVNVNTINLYIVNSSEELPVHAWIQNISINGIFLENVGCEGYAEKNTSNISLCVIPLKELQSREITRINELKFNLLLYLGSNYITETEEFIFTR